MTQTAWKCEAEYAKICPVDHNSELRRTSDAHPSPKGTQVLEIPKNWPAVLQRGFPGGSDSKESAHKAGDLGSIPGQEDPLEKEMATHSSILAWRRSPGEGTGSLERCVSSIANLQISLLSYTLF